MMGKRKRGAIQHAFTVEACGSAEVARPYTMNVTIRDGGIQLDDLYLSWNDARAAFESYIEANAMHEWIVSRMVSQSKRRRK